MPRRLKLPVNYILARIGGVDAEVVHQLTDCLKIAAVSSTFKVGQLTIRKVDDGFIGDRLSVLTRSVS